MAPRKRHQTQLTRDAIVSAAIKLADEHGLEGHTMRQLGAELGVDASTIYYHVPSKSALYDLIVDEVMRGVDLSIDDPSKSFEERLLAAANEFVRALLVHPKLMPLMSARSFRTETQLRSVELLLGIFYDAGFSPTEAVTASDIFGMTALGMANAVAAHTTQSEYLAQSDEFAELSETEFPNMTRLLAEGRYVGWQAEYEAAMRALARGLLALHADDEMVPSADGDGSTPAPQTLC